ncbi:MAG: hypothetical protein HY323_05485 [Betaproteobacteria bacterium]|nr:hypothetical protein [Betaproteobacteria bacterium]
MREWTEPVWMEDHPHRYVRYASGEVRRDVDVTLTEDQYRQMWQGYRCCRCYGIVSSAFPQTCGLPGCDGYPDGFPMAERQRQVMEAEYDGYKWIGPSRETIARLQAADAPKGKPKGTSTIWVPRGVEG